MSGSGKMRQRRERDGRAWRYEPTGSRPGYPAALMNDALGPARTGAPRWRTSCCR